MCACFFVLFIWCAVIADDGASGLIDTKALLSLLHKPDQVTPSLPSLHLDSRLAPQPVPSQGLSVCSLRSMLD